MTAGSHASGNEGGGHLRQVCAGCSGAVAAGGGRGPHLLLPEEAEPVGAAAGVYHDRCCPECNGGWRRLPPFTDFAGAAGDVLAHLQCRLGFELWMVARLEGMDWVVLAARSPQGRVGPGQRLAWSQSPFLRRVVNEGSRIVPDCSRLRPRHDASGPLGGRLGAYAGAPLEAPDGTMLAVLCGCHPKRVPPAVQKEQPLLELQARLLSTVLVASRQPAAAV